MIDPLRMIFVPGAFATVAVLAMPAAFALHQLWRRRGRRLNASSKCGRCRGYFGISELFRFGGVLVCPRCAQILRRELYVVLPVLVVGAIGFALSSGWALYYSSTHNGPGFTWWLDGRWIPLLMPSVGVAIATAGAIAVGKRQNQLAEADHRNSLSGGAVDSSIVPLPRAQELTRDRPSVY